MYFEREILFLACLIKFNLITLALSQNLSEILWTNFTTIVNDQNQPELVLANSFTTATSISLGISLTPTASTLPLFPMNFSWR